MCESEQAWADVVCPYCEGDEHTSVYNITRPTRTEVLLCLRCGLGFQANPLREAELEAYYASSSTGYAHGHGSRSARLVACRHQCIDPFLELSATSSRSQGQIVDIGCGFGDFLASWRDNPFGKEARLIGVELNPERIHYARERLGLEVLERSYSGVEWSSNQTDLVTAFGVLEHLEEPAHFFSIIYRMLKPQGLLVVSVPDLDRPLIALSEFFQIEHILYFSAEVLKKMAESAGFTIEHHTDTTPSYPDITLVLRKPARDGTVVPKTYSNWKPDRRWLQRIESSLRTYSVERHRLQRRVKQILDKYGVFGILDQCAIYGAGEHTKELISAFPQLESIPFFLDSDPKKVGLSFCKGTIYQMSDLSTLPIKKVIISSQAFEDEMAAALIEFKKTVGGSVADIDVITLYSNEAK